MEKFIKKISYIEIGILIACVIFMFFPYIYINVGSIDTTANAWHTIFGIDKSTTGITSFSSFSILCLLVYILLFIIFLLLVFFDNQANVLIDLVKIVLFLGTGFMFIFYLFIRFIALAIRLFFYLGPLGLLYMLVRPRRRIYRRYYY